MMDPLELKANEPLQLMYRVLVHAGSLDKETIDEEYQLYCELE